MSNKELVAWHDVHKQRDGVMHLVKKFTRKMFREEMNETAKGRVDAGGKAWRNNIYGNRKRAYGDYLYTQDRDMFEDDYRRWLISKL